MIQPIATPIRITDMIYADILTKRGFILFLVCSNASLSVYARIIAIAGNAGDAWKKALHGLL